MKMNRIIPLGVVSMLISLSMFAGIVLAEEGPWQTDFEAAKAQAKAEKKIMLVDFTGSDWCGFCIKLKDEVFEKEPFKSEVSKHFVLVELDFPHEKKLPDELKAQNDKLVKEYKISGYPTIFLMDAEAKVIARFLGYGPGTSAKYLERLNEAPKIWETVLKMKSELDAAQGLDRVKLLDQVVETYDKLDNPSDELQTWSKEIVALDPENKNGLKPKYEFRISMIETDKLIEEKKVAEAVAVLNKALAISGLDKEQNGKIEGMLKRYTPIAEALATYLKIRPDLDKAEGLDRAKLLDQLIIAYQKLGMFAASISPAPNIVAWSKEIISLDADNKAGLKIKYEFNQFLSEATKLAQQKKYEEGLAAIGKALTLPGIAPEQTQEGLAAMGTNYLAQKDFEKSLDSFKKALEAAPKGSRAALIQIYINYVEQQQKKAAEEAKKEEPKKEEGK